MKLLETEEIITVKKQRVFRYRIDFKILFTNIINIMCFWRPAKVPAVGSSLRNRRNAGLITAAPIEQAPSEIKFYKEVSDRVLEKEKTNPLAPKNFGSIS